jgi:methylglyoxal synthase
VSLSEYLLLVNRPERAARVHAAVTVETCDPPTVGAQEVVTVIARGTPARRCLALVAHDNKKLDLLEWARYNRDLLARHDLVATGTTGRLLARELDLDITCLRSGPLGGDQQLGAMITDQRVDLLLFFWDPLEPQPHDPDVKALLRIAVVWNTPIACNRATADYLISSPLLDAPYVPMYPSYDIG